MIVGKRSFVVCHPGRAVTAPPDRPPTDVVVAALAPAQLRGSGRLAVPEQGVLGRADPLWPLQLSHSASAIYDSLQPPVVSGFEIAGCWWSGCPVVDAGDHGVEVAAASVGEVGEVGEPLAG